MKTLLSLTRFRVNKVGTVAVDRSKTFSVMLNPSEITHQKSIRYSPTEIFGQVGRDAKFHAVGPDSISFAIVLDGTGAVPPATPGAPPADVKTQIAALNQIVYDYDGEDHQPGHVRVLWGSLILFGRLESMSTQYTLFKPTGEPLRARVTLGFTGFMSSKESDLVANRSSPDLSHVVEVREGDTLPLLCNRIYGDPGYYADVARFNGLTDFRRLAPGATLHFPPLE